VKILLAAFYTPGVRAIEHLLSVGIEPQGIKLLTHATERNRVLLEYARVHGIETKTDPIRESHVQKWVGEFRPDLLFSLYYRDIVPGSVLRKISLASLNLHPSLLPNYRGTFSAPWAIINGEAVTGISYHEMEEEIDTGAIIYQEATPVLERDTAYSLYHRLIDIGMRAFESVFEAVLSGEVEKVPQKGAGSYFPRRVPNDGYIDTSWSREKVERFLRAMYFPPFSGAKIKLETAEERWIKSIDEYDAIVSGQLIGSGGADICE